MKLKISDIVIEERQREDFGDLHQLADSIKELGQLVPIIVDKKNMQLIAGERRIQALRLLGRKEVEAVFQEDLTPIMRKKMELAENIIRKDLTWEEEVRATAELAELEQGEQKKGKPGPKGLFEQRSGKSLGEIAKSLGKSKSTLAQDIELAKALDVFPQLANETNKTTAFKRYKRAMSTAITKELLQRGEVKHHKDLRLGRAEELIKKVEDESVDLILFDPPFGVQLETTSSVGRSASAEGTYEFKDTLKASRDVCSALFPDLFRVLKDPGVMFAFFPIQHYQWFFDEISRSFGKASIAHIPLIWYKGRGGTMYSGRNFSGAYETFFFVRKGKPTLYKDRTDVFDYKRVAGQKRIHVAEKPVAFYQDLIETTTVSGALVLDPMFGSGASIEAALRCQRKALGFEMSSAVYARACERLEELQEGEQVAS